MPLLINDNIRYKIGLLRFYKNKKNIKFFQDSNTNFITNTVKYNFQALKNIKTDFQMQRIKWLIFGILANEFINQKSKILFVGPRTENEILFLKALGYANVIGLDLFSYSPWIKLGDMHKIPFSNSLFDAVICGWALSYSKKPNQVAKELLRVCKKGGVVGIGLEHIPRKELKIMKKSISNKEVELCKSEIANKRINSVNDIFKMFNKNRKIKIIFNHDAPLAAMPSKKIQAITGLAKSQCIAVVRKN